MKHIWSFLLFLHCIPCYSAVVVQGNSAASPKGFATPINAETYDRGKGNFFVGLLNGTDIYTISKASRPSFTTPTTFTGILKSDSELLNTSILLLAISEQENNKSVLATVSSDNPLKIIGLFDDGSSEIPSADMADMNDAAGNTAESIPQIVASSTHVFAALSANGGTFGDAGSGIGLISISIANSVLTFDIKNANTGINGNLAVPLDNSSTVLKGDGGGNDVTILNEDVGMFWDPIFERLYISVTLQTGAAATDIGKAIVVGRLNTSQLILEKIVIDGAISGGGVDEIIVTEGADIILGSRFPRVMHTSTGPDYLIVDCVAAATCNRIFALPLVFDTSSPSEHGTLANKNSILNANFKFTDPATAPGDLVVNDPITDPFGVVGAGDLPIQPDEQISDMVVVGDGVYVSINVVPSVDNDTGVFYSQAMFDNTGKIIRWTPWTKRGVSLNAFPGITLPGGVVHDGAIRFLEVDGKTGNIWIVEGTTQQVAGITSWTTGTLSTGLISSVGKALSKSSYSVLDLDQATRGFLNTTIQRYALFGGVNKVVFARTTQARDITSLSSPQIVITDFSLDENFLITSLPEKAGCCQALEYSRTSTTAGDENNLNYFFAGTENGLFVYTDDGGNGFNALDLSTLNIAPFTNRTWQKVSIIQGSVVDLQTTGTGPLYILTLNSTDEKPLMSTVFSVPHKPTIGEMFNPSNIRTIAETGVGVFANVVEFFGFQVLATGEPFTTDPQDKEQLVLASNQGLFRSNADQTAGQGVASALNQTAANWSVVADANNTTAKTMYFGIAGIDTPIPNTVWPFSVQDQNKFMTYDRASIHQFSGNGTDGDANGNPPLFNSFFIPLQFNSSPETTNLKTLDPIIYFHSDGGRRFFLFNRVQDPPTQIRLGVIPYHIEEWNVTQPELINYPTLSVLNQMYWIKQIGATGLLLLGTGSGVIGLE